MCLVLCLFLTQRDLALISQPLVAPQILTPLPHLGKQRGRCAALAAGGGGAWLAVLADGLTGLYVHISGKTWTVNERSKSFTVTEIPCVVGTQI